MPIIVEVEVWRGMVCASLFSSAQRFQSVGAPTCQPFKRAMEGDGWLDQKSLQESWLAVWRSCGQSSELGKASGGNKRMVS